MSIALNTRITIQTKIINKTLPRIKILSDRVANQIAAGEVIERPVAVIKELVENSIDAQATKIAIEINNGGKSLIKISDNGIGMNEDEALLSLERHATSKLREANDLNQITSFGFRGEALPSIASVSQFTLKTRTKDSIEGVEINVTAGKLLSQKACRYASWDNHRCQKLVHWCTRSKKIS